LFAAPGSLVSKYFKESQLLKNNLCQLVTKRSIADHDANKHLFTENFASSTAHVMKSLPLTQFIFDNFSSSIMTTGNKMVQKADTIFFQCQNGKKPNRHLHVIV
jgi:hypothetical protein